MTHHSSWSPVALLSGLKGCWAPDGGRMNEAFGTPTLLLTDAMTASLIHITWWCLYPQVAVLYDSYGAWAPMIELSAR
ncbi:hypothetical protein BO71DRAFT_254286 [Aspergillus ellipticus CBS 707.79]|uniref:Uncharacterized protein n=1 Tax=Aspergillus ellipticus CBS 707.79 TaxID=1448320 RepID=A0A319D8F8_9EURO|nr:hypothetical protein BO71DRAFT_254286 [Aspergillus ellipticus CBS 707.79]